LADGIFHQFFRLVPACLVVASLAYGDEDRYLAPHKTFVSPLEKGKILQAFGKTHSPADRAGIGAHVDVRHFSLCRSDRELACKGADRPGVTEITPSRLAATLGSTGPSERNGRVNARHLNPVTLASLPGDTG
jgi:hypothetical protein